MSRRVDGVATGVLWHAVEERLRALSTQVPALLSFLDGKPLPVGGCTKDRDARYGRGAGMMAKGYKLHVVWSNGPLPEAWEVTPLNADEPTVAHRLIPQLRGTGYLLGDGNYDVQSLYDSAARQGYQLVTPPPKDPPGRRPQSPQRLHSIEMVSRPFGKELYQSRIRVESLFGNATSFGGGLSLRRKPAP